MHSVAKCSWTRAERMLLLRAWQEVVEANPAAVGKTKAAITEHVYARFVELANGDCKRTMSAMEIQKSILVFNFTFIARYNLVHGANAWDTLSPGERAEVFGREKTSSYNFVDLDQDMVKAITSIRSHFTPGSGCDNTIPRRPMLLKTSVVRPKPVRRMSASDAAYHAIAGQRRDAASKNANTSEGSSSESDTSDYETAESIEQTVVAAPRKRVRRAEPNVQVPKTELVAILVAHQKTTRRLERLLAGKRSFHGAHRLSASSVVMSARDVNSAEGRR